MALERFVEQLERLGPLTVEEMQALRSLPGRYWDLPAGLDFSEQTAPGTDRILVLAEGLLASCYYNSDGERQLTSLYVPGDLCDLNTLVLPTEPMCLTSLARSRVYVVARGSFAEAMRLHPGLIGLFWRYSSSRVLILTQRVVSLGSRDARQRVAHLMCELAVRYGRSLLEPSATFRLPMRQHHIASALGLTSVHINRTLRALRADQIMLFRHETVTVLDGRRLAQEADFDPGYLESYLQ